MNSLYTHVVVSAAAFARKYHKYLAALLLVVMFGLAYTAMLGNSAIDDELAHIPAAYSYWHFGDYRLNPEHPPLMKDLAGLPLQFLNLKFPTNSPSWTVPNNEWNAGNDFLFYLGNNANLILYWARLPILLFSVGFGVWIYAALRKRWGIAVALLGLFFYTLSPNMLASADIVTTDIGVSLFIFASLLMFGKFVSRPTIKNGILLSFVIAGAELSKFSAAVLYPFLFLIALSLVWLAKDTWPRRIRLKKYVGGFVLVSVLSFAWIWAVYAVQTINMPSSVQQNLIAGSLADPRVSLQEHVMMAMSRIPTLKGPTQYLLGLQMDAGRIQGGNVTYLNGHVTDQSYRAYFPEIFALKTQVAFLILMLVALVYSGWRFRHRKIMQPLTQMAQHYRTHVTEWVLGLFAGFYFLVAEFGNLDLGIRHIIPIYLPLFTLIAIGTVQLARRASRTQFKVLSAAVLTLLLGWYGGATLAVHPYYIPYFNEIIGGPANAELYFSDSSVDWGQDLGRLVSYVNAHPEIHQIAVDYFGGAIPQYYFCSRVYSHGQLVTDGSFNCNGSKFVQWHSQNGRYHGQYIAVSETYLENDLYFAALTHQPGYGYLRAMKPIAKIGYSIYIYKMY